MASVASKFGLSDAGSFGGVQPPILMAGKYIHPSHCNLTNFGMNTTGARYYIVPIFVPRNTTFAGAWCFNSGAGDNGDKVKIAAYSEATTGGPGARAKNFGEVTLTGASALRNFASSWSAVGPLWYYLELVTDNAVGMWGMTSLSYASDAGYFAPNTLANQLGFIGGPSGSSKASPTGDYVGGTYANFPEATSLTPTATLADPGTSGGTSGVFPAFGLYT
jgi:hypothetical protein